MGISTEKKLLKDTLTPEEIQELREEALSFGSEYVADLEDDLNGPADMTGGR